MKFLSVRRPVREGRSSCILRKNCTFLLYLLYSCCLISRWLDGPLLDLTAEMLESELEDYWHELFKVQKLLVTKLKKAKADSKHLRRRRSALDPNSTSQLDIPLPPNSENTLAFITTIQDRMKDFKASFYSTCRPETSGISK